MPFTDIHNHSIDLTNTTFIPATTGDITFIDCDFTGFNATPVILRAGDTLLYTKPNTNCPSYVDNATALAALGEGYYYKDTTTSKFEVTIN